MSVRSLCDRRRRDAVSDGEVSDFVQSQSRVQRIAEELLRVRVLLPGVGGNELIDVCQRFGTQQIADEQQPTEAVKFST